MTPFDVNVDLKRRLLRLTMRGFWDIATFDAFAAEFERALQALHRTGGCEAAIVDGRQFAVQSTDILARFGDVMQRNAPYLAKRTASIVPAELNRMQSARVAKNINKRDFSTPEEAEEWLFGDGGNAEQAA